MKRLIKCKGFWCKTFWLGSLALVFMVASYIYLVNATVLRIVARGDAERDIRHLTTEIAKAEMEYYELAEELDLDYAYSQGFHETEAVNYIVLRNGENGISYLSE